MIIRKREAGEVVVLELDGRLDSNTAPDLEIEIDRVNAGETGSHLLIDLIKLDYISSAGLRVILKAFKERQKQPKSFAVCGMQEHVREVFEISGFDSYITIYTDSEEALKSL